MRKLLIALLLLATTQLVFTGCSSDDSMTPVEMGDDQGNQNEDPIPLEAEERMNVSYGSDPQQIYDLYLPAGRTRTQTKVIVLVHGGGWTGGDKADMSEFVDLIKEKHPNHAIANINYVLANVNTPAFPNQFLDVGRAIDKLKDEADELVINPEFGLIGTSAGAHLSLQYDYVYDTDDVVKMVCDIVGPSDLTDPFYANDPNYQILLSLLVDESAYPPGTDYAAAISPALQVSASSSPSILFYGNMDPLVPLSNGETLQQALSDNMITHSYTVYEGGHGDDWSPASYVDLENQLSNFINTHLPIN